MCNQHRDHWGSLSEAPPIAEWGGSKVHSLIGYTPLLKQKLFFDITPDIKCNNPLLHHNKQEAKRIEWVAYFTAHFVGCKSLDFP